jgi:hypothetical protein
MRPKCRTGFPQAKANHAAGTNGNETTKRKAATRCDYGSGSKLQLLGICYFLPTPFIYLAQILSSEHLVDAPLISQTAGSDSIVADALDSSRNAGEAFSSESSKT